MLLTIFLSTIFSYSIAFLHFLGNVLGARLIRGRAIFEPKKPPIK